MKNEGPLLPMKPMPETPSSQKMAKPPQRRLKGMVKVSLEWKMTLGLGLPDQRRDSPEVSSCCRFLCSSTVRVSMDVWAG